MARTAETNTSRNGNGDPLPKLDPRCVDLSPFQCDRLHDIAVVIRHDRLDVASVGSQLGLKNRKHLAQYFRIGRHQLGVFRHRRRYLGQPKIGPKGALPDLYELDEKRWCKIAQRRPKLARRKSSPERTSDRNTLVAAVTPRQTGMPTGTCERLRQIIELLWTEGELNAKSIGERLGFKNVDAVRRYLVDGHYLGILKRDDGIGTWHVDGNGLQKLHARKSLGGKSPFDNLPKGKQRLLDSANWESIGFSDANAWRLTTIVAAIGHQRFTSYQELSREVSYEWTSVKARIDAAKKHEIIRVRRVLGCSIQTWEYTINWKAIERLGCRRLPLRFVRFSQRNVKRYTASVPRGRRQFRVVPDNRLALQAADWKKTGCRTEHQWGLIAELIELIGDERRVATDELVVELGHSSAKVNGALNNARKLNLITVEYRHDAGLTGARCIRRTNWQRIAECAGSRISFGQAANGDQPQQAGKGESVTMERCDVPTGTFGQVEVWAHARREWAKFKNQFPDASYREGLFAYRKAYPQKPIPIKDGKPNVGAYRAAMLRKPKQKPK